MHRMTDQSPLLDRDTLVAIVSHMTGGCDEWRWRSRGSRKCPVLLTGFGNDSTGPGERVLVQR